MPENRKRRLRLILSAVSAAVIAPLLVALGIAVWDDRKFYIVSILIIISSMLPFLLRFERKKAAARELVALASMIAIGVAGRAAFYMVPQFKPMVAIAIISGVAFGCESGFMVGAMTAFVSNFIFGQGPWTPWQMEAAGLMGFFGGLLFCRRDGALPKLVPLLIYGALGTLLIYGPIVDTSTVFTVYAEPTWEQFTAAFASGFVLNLVHAAATVIFLLVLARPMLKKLNRIKVKYGILE